MNEQPRIPVILYPRFEQLQHLIERCQRMTKRFGEPRCLALEGATGTGKTTLARYYEAQFPVIETSNGIIKPVLYIQTPARITVPSFTESMLAQMGDPGSYIHTRETGRPTKLEARLDALLKDSSASLVIVDDFQHLLNIDTEKQKKAISDWLKVRIKNTGCTLSKHSRHERGLAKKHFPQFYPTILSGRLRQQMLGSALR